MNGLSKKMLNKLKDKIEDWFIWVEKLWDTIENIFWYNPKRFIINFINYRKFLANNMWFDHSYIFQILKMKLENDVKYYKKYSLSLNSGEYVEEMETCIKLLDRIINDVYFDLAYEEHDKKWGKLNMEFKDEDDRKYLEFSRKNVITEEDKEKERKEFLKCCHAESQMRQQDIDNLFDFMKRNILKWWD